MIDFQPIDIQHKALFEEINAVEQSRNAGYSFGNVFLWDLVYKRNIARIGDRIGIEYLYPQGIFYAFPSGVGELKPAIEALRLRAAQHDRPLELRCVTPPQREQLEAACPGAFTYTEDRDNFDYVYDIEAFMTLSGKKLHGKRNFCNRFEREHNWRFEPLAPAHFDDCLALLETWDEEHTQVNQEEQLAIERVFQYWDKLGMLGGVLYTGERLAAFTIAEPLAADTVDVHFEKGLNNIPGAYPMIAREFARYIHTVLPEVKLLNREEDMGIENLRLAKEEWHPLFLLEKYTAVWNKP